MSDFQKNIEFEKLKQNINEIKEAILTYINRTGIKKACEIIQDSLYNDKFSFCLSEYEYNFYVQYKKARDIQNHYTILITDDYPATSYVLDFYVIPDGKKNSNGFNTYKLVSESEYLRAVDKEKLLDKKDFNKDKIAYLQDRQQCFDFVKEIETKINSLKNPLRIMKYLINLEKEMRKGASAGLVSDKLMRKSSKNIEDIIDAFILPYGDNTKSIQLFKIAYVTSKKDQYRDNALTEVRLMLLKQLKEDGIEAIINVDIDSSIDLNDKYLINAIDNGNVSYESIIKNAYRNEYRIDKYYKKLVQALKIYYDFNNMDERNTERLGEFLAKYDILKSAFIASLFQIGKSSGAIRNWKWIDGTPWDKLPPDIKHTYKEFTPDLYRFKKKVKLMTSRGGSEKDENGKYITLKTTAKYGQALLDKMQVVAAQFNESRLKDDNTEILDIYFNDEKDRSFIFEFVTFKADGKEPDGRRLGEFTAMFNRSLPDIGTIYLDYEN